MANEPSNLDPASLPYRRFRNIFLAFFCAFCTEWLDRHSIRLFIGRKHLERGHDLKQFSVTVAVAVVLSPFSTSCVDVA